MNHEMINKLFSSFISTYNIKEKDHVWTNLSNKFSSFWFDKIVNGNSEELTESDIDEIVRILDSNGKGNKKGDEAVARAMVAQGTWRKLFYELCTNKKLSAVITNILAETDINKKSLFIDELYTVNSGRKNSLTGPSGNVINSMLAAFDPSNNLSMISLQDRLRFIETFTNSLPSDFDSFTIGKKFITTNNLIQEEFAKYGINKSARTISCFCYNKDILPLWKTHLTVKRPEKSIVVTIPQDNDHDNLSHEETEDPRESFQIQALLSEVGSKMGFSIWLPRNDKNRVLKCISDKNKINLLTELPLNYNIPVMKTIENIDVLWLKRGMIVRAFEVEHTTAVYSGILRMSDLLALLPNIDIKLHIVAPTYRSEKVFEEIKRPTFSLLEKGPMAELCSFISYDNIRDLSNEKHLEHLSNTVLDDYCEWADNNY